MALWVAILRDDITSLVTWAGVSDIYLTYEERLDMRKMMKRVIGGTPIKYPKGYEQRDVLPRLKEMKVPTLIIHGEQDLNVSFKHAKVLEHALIGNSIPVETWYYSDFTHFFPSKINRRVVKDATQWMKNQKGDY